MEGQGPDSALALQPVRQSARGGRHLGPGDVEAGLVAEPGVGHRLALAAGDVIEQQAEFGRRVRRGEAAQVRQVVVVQRDDVVEAGEVGARDLTGAKGADVDPVPRGDGDGPLIRRLARMPVPRAGGVDDQVEAAAGGFGAEGGLGEGGATDVAEADEEDGGHQTITQDSTDSSV